MTSSRRFRGDAAPMTVDQTFAFVLFAVVAAVTPGPSNILLTSIGANVGVRRGMPCLFGVAVGMGLMLFVVAFGLGNLVLGSPFVVRGLKWGGVAVLLWLSWKIATAGPNDPATAKEVVGFWGAASFQWLNPKSWLVGASAAGTYLDAEASGAFAQSASFGVVFALAALPSCFAWLAFGATVQRALRSERAARAFNVGMGALLAASIYLVIR